MASVGEGILCASQKEGVKLNTHQPLPLPQKTLLPHLRRYNIIYFVKHLVRPAGVHRRRYPRPYELVPPERIHIRFHVVYLILRIVARC